MTDQHHARAMSCAGSVNVRTPNLDAIAASGTRFENAYANSPICGPSRCCFLTGQYPWHHGVLGNTIRGFPGEARANVAAAFREAGYRTGLVGKAHLPARWVNEGFEHVRLSDLADAATDNPLTCDYFGHLVRSGYADEFDQGALPPSHPGHGMKGFVSKIPYRHSLEAWTGREARKFIAETSDSRPFFLQASFQRPHDPYAPSPDHPLPRVNPADIVLPGSARDFFDGFTGHPSFQQEYAGRTKGEGYPYRPENVDDLKANLACYLDLVQAIDAEIGAILGTLRERGFHENTIVLYVSDHGDFAGDHGLLLKNLGIYDSIQRIPFLLSYPGGPRGGVCPSLVESVDLAPTVCELAGVPFPRETDGVAIGPRNDAPSASKREAPCYWEFPIADPEDPQSRVFAIRTKDWSFVHYLPTGESELYDRNEDPGESRNIANLPSSESVIRELEQRMRAHLENARIHHPAAKDAAVRDALAESPTFALHKKGVLWSEIAEKVS